MIKKFESPVILLVAGIADQASPLDTDQAASLPTPGDQLTSSYDAQNTAEKPKMYGILVKNLPPRSTGTAFFLCGFRPHQFSNLLDEIFFVKNFQQKDEKLKKLGKNMKKWCWFE